MERDLDIAWASDYQMPPVGNMMRSGDNAKGVFIRQGTRIAKAIGNVIEECFNKQISRLDIMDFACGVGRVALPLYNWHRRPNAAADVSADAVRYLQSQIPGANPIVSPEEPPTSYKDHSFDVIYSISLWTHLPLERQYNWLNELKRIVRPDGLVLISTSGYSALKSRRERLKDWVSVSDEDLRKQGMIFIGNTTSRGVSSKYGYAAHDPEWIQRTWTKYFSQVITRKGLIEGIQDLQILSNRR